MSAFLSALLDFPTVLFAGLAALSLVYWLLVLVGALDLDALDGVAGHVHGAAEAGAHGAAHAMQGVDATSALGEALAALGLTRVPVTISSSSFAWLGLFGSITTRLALDAHVPHVVSALLALVVGGGCGLGAAIGSARLLRSIFDDTEAPRGGRALIGRICTITIEVDARGGQATISEDGHHIVVAARSGSGVLASGTQALIVEQADDGVFVLDALPSSLAADHDAFAELARRAADSSAHKAPSSAVADAREHVVEPDPNTRSRT